MKYGLKQETVQNIQCVFSAFPEVEEVILYGSRAKGNFKNASDIDLTIKGENLSLKLINKISFCLDDLYLPYTFDLSIFNHISSPDLIEHIQRVGQIFYKKSEALKEEQIIKKEALIKAS